MRSGTLSPLRAHQPCNLLNGPIVRVATGQAQYHNAPRIVVAEGSNVGVIPLLIAAVLAGPEPRLALLPRPRNRLR